MSTKKLFGISVDLLGLNASFYAYVPWKENKPQKTFGFAPPDQTESPFTTGVGDKKKPPSNTA